MKSLFCLICILVSPCFAVVRYHTNANGSISTTSYTPDDAAHFQTAVNAALTGDVIECTADVTYSFGAVPLSLGGNSQGSWVTVRSSGFRNLADGGWPGTITGTGTTATVAPPSGAQLASMCHLVANDGATQTVVINENTTGWTLEGLDVQGTNDNATTSGAPWLGVPVQVGTITFAQQVTIHSITIKKNWLHGVYEKNGPKACVYVYAATGVVIKDNYINECKWGASFNGGQDTQAVLMVSCVGCSIIDNYLQGAGENVLLGGFNASSGSMSGKPQGLALGTFAESIKIIGNWFDKDIRWKRTFSANAPSGTGLYWNGQGEYWMQLASGCNANGLATGLTSGTNTATGHTWQAAADGTWTDLGTQTLSCDYTDIKNEMEVKQGFNVYIFGNYLSNGWVAQQPAPVIINPSPYPPITDYTFAYNFMQGHPMFFARGFDNGGTINPNNALNIQVIQNICNDCSNPMRIGPLYNGNPGTLKWSITNSPDLLRHNSFPNATNGLYFAYASPSTNPAFVIPRILDNLAPFGSTAWVTGDSFPNPATLMAQPNSGPGGTGAGAQHWPGGQILNNIVPINGATPAYGGGMETFLNAGAFCCQGNQFPTTSSLVFTNEPGINISHVVDNALMPTGGTACGGFPCVNTALDGTNPGADVASVGVFTDLAYSNYWNKMGFGSVTYPSNTSATVVWYVPQAPVPLGGIDSACVGATSLTDNFGSTVGSHSLVRTGWTIVDTVTGLTAGTHYYYRARCTNLSIDRPGQGTLYREFNERF